MLTEPYWRESETLGDGMSGLVSMVSSYRIGYNWGSEGADWSLMSDIESKIRELHAKVGNAKVRGRGAPGTREGARAAEAGR